MYIYTFNLYIYTYANIHIMFIRKTASLSSAQPHPLLSARFATITTHPSPSPGEVLIPTSTFILHIQ